MLGLILIFLLKIHVNLPKLYLVWIKGHSPRVKEFNIETNNCWKVGVGDRGVSQNCDQSLQNLDPLLNL